MACGVSCDQSLLLHPKSLHLLNPKITSQLISNDEGQKESPLTGGSWNEEGRVQNWEAVDAKEIYPREYTMWREDPSNFSVNGVYPIRQLWSTARQAWSEILLTSGEHFLVVTHKSILRAMLCTALGLGPERFRAVDANNGSISVFNFNIKGEGMLQSLNMTAHLYSHYKYIY